MESKVSLSSGWQGISGSILDWSDADFIWDDAPIYMVMTDRFVNGNTSNDGAPSGAEERLIGWVVT